MYSLTWYAFTSFSFPSSSKYKNKSPPFPCLASLHIIIKAGKSGISSSFISISCFLLLLPTKVNFPPTCESYHLSASSVISVGSKSMCSSCIVDSPYVAFSLSSLEVSFPIRINVVSNNLTIRAMTLL